MTFKQYFSQYTILEATIQTLTPTLISNNIDEMEQIETRNFSGYYAADSSEIIDDSQSDGFLGTGIFNNENQIVGYAYGFQLEGDGETYLDDDIDMSNINFYDEEFRQTIESKGITSICNKRNTFYVSNLVVSKKYRIHVYRLIADLLNKIKNAGYKYIVFDALSDTQRLFDSTRKYSRLSNNNLKKLADMEDYDSALTLFQIL